MRLALAFQLRKPCAERICDPRGVTFDVVYSYAIPFQRGRRFIDCETGVISKMHLGHHVRAGLILAISCAPLVMPAAAHAAESVTVSAGAESQGGDVQLNEFAPVQVTVNVGDSVTWSLDSTEFHDVVFTAGGAPPDFVQPGADGVFLNPLAVLPQGGSSYDGSDMVASGLLNKGQSWSVMFTKAGTYPYFCAIHQGMVGSVQVLGSGQTADTQAAIDARRSAQVNMELATRSVPSIMANLGQLDAAGATAGIVAGIQNGPSDVQRFLPPRVVIHAGDSLTWEWKTQETPHTVTFLAGQAAPEVVIPQPQASGPPRFQLNPVVLAPAGDPTNWNGGTYLNSGFLQPMPNQPEPEFTVHFSNPGTYNYVCVLHQGMVGTIVVEPR